MTGKKVGGQAKFSFKNTEFTISITYGFAMKTLKEKFGINLLNLFEGNNLDEFINIIQLNDELMLKLWWHYVENKVNLDYDKAIDYLTQDNMTEFKEAFWAAVMNFFDPTRRQMLQQIKEDLKELMLKTVKTNLQLAKQSSEDGSSSTLENVESES